MCEFNKEYIGCNNIIESYKGPPCSNYWNNPATCENSCSREYSLNNMGFPDKPIDPTEPLQKCKWGQFSTNNFECSLDKNTNCPIK